MMGRDQLIAYIIACGVPGALVFVLVCLSTKRRRPLLSLVAGAATIAGVYLAIRSLWPEPKTIQVTIDPPTAGYLVQDPWIRITGGVAPSTADVYVMVHPCSAIKWWVQPLPRIVGGAWVCDVNLGTATEGKGECFQIIAVATTSPRFVEIMRGRSLAEGDTLARPPPLTRSEILTIWRRK